jgi:hypothetical protein
MGELADAVHEHGGHVTGIIAGSAVRRVFRRQALDSTAS